MTTFHRNRGTDLSLSDDHRTATVRGGGGCNTVFSSQPLQPGHKLTLNCCEGRSRYNLLLITTYILYVLLTNTATSVQYITHTQCHV